MLNDEEACQYRLKSFGHPATQHKYIIDGDKQMTAVDYFNDMWKFPLRYPHLPVVELYHPNDNNMLPGWNITARKRYKNDRKRPPLR